MEKRGVSSDVPETAAAFQVLAREEAKKKKKEKNAVREGTEDGRAQLFDFESGLCIIQRELKLFPIRGWISGTVLHRALCLRLVAK